MGSKLYRYIFMMKYAIINKSNIHGIQKKKKKKKKKKNEHNNNNLVLDEKNKKDSNLLC